LLAVARHENSRRCLLLLESILETPSLSERLLEVLRPEESAATPLRRAPKLVASEMEHRPGKVDGARKSSNGAKGNGSERRGGSKR
jgi:hypothetical protein